MERKEALNRVRRQVMLVRRLTEQMRELSPDGMHSLQLTGMPRASGGTARGLEMQLYKKEAMERMLRRETEVLRSYERAARETMDGMRPELYSFCVMYYINGFTLEETGRTLDRCKRQCARYRQEIESA